jgi:septum formation protein
VLQQAGIDPLVIVSGVDEDAIAANLPPDVSPAEITLALASAKAEAVTYHLAPSLAADCVVIGCDSMLYAHGRLRGKPGTADAALRDWQQMSGSSGQLFTGHCLIRLQDNAITHRGADATVTSVQFGRPSESDLKAYIESGEPMRVAGAFTLDGLGGWFIDSVQGDPSAVIGIGLPTVGRLLAAAGLSLTQLWRANRISNSVP